MAHRVSSILGPDGAPYVHRNGKPRPALAEALARKQRDVRASYDAARDTDDFKNYWANADRYDADSANSRAVREKLVPRSRYEIYNNGYADGISQTYATDVVGVGPVLRMGTASAGFNQMVEAEWKLWVKAIGLRRKLWCMAHAKHSDGEAFAVLRRNPGVKHAIPLDVVLYETEQVQTPMLPYDVAGYIDGIKFDEFGNPVWYDLMRWHPGGVGFSSHLDWKPETVRAAFMLHWFKLRRPGQHRGIPESTSTLNTGAAARRFREATVAAAETAADISVLLETEMPAESEADPLEPFDSVAFEKRMLVASPKGWKAKQMAAEHPNASYESFTKSLINEQARPKSMPYNKAACDSSSYNYASGRLDHQTYYGALDVDREDANDLVLDPLFDLWFSLAIERFGWLGGKSEAVSPAARAHGWDWPKHRVADVEAEADANDTKLRNGSISLSKLYSQDGEDFEDELTQMAKDFGRTPDEVREMLLAELHPEAVKQQADLYGAAVRAGLITPQIDDEEIFRKRLGLPPVSEAVRQTWEKDGGTRRPITLTTPKLIEDATGDPDEAKET